MSEENIEVIRRQWAAWLRGDIDSLAATWDAEIIWDTSRMHSWPERSYKGIDGVRKFLTEWLEVWGEYEINLEEVTSAPDGRVVSLFTHRGRGKQSGVPMLLEMAQIATLRDGKTILFENYDDRAEALEAAGLSE